MQRKLNTVKTQRRYHHGDLRETLITIGEAVLVERGVSGFSLREVARRAAVSPAAPAHHFKDARALLTAISARGFQRLTDALRSAEQGAAKGKRMQLQGDAYVRFAKSNAALFTLMWARELLDTSDPDYLAAGRAAFNVFEQAALKRPVKMPSGPRRPNAAIVAAWAMIHGYARLLLDGALEDSEILRAAVFSYLPRLTPRQTTATG